MTCVKRNELLHRPLLYRRHNLTILSLLFFVCCYTKPILAEQAETQVWSDGNDDIVFLVYSQEQEGKQGFRICYKLKTKDTFRKGNWYPGRPDKILLHNKRLIIFFKGGACQSYGLIKNYPSEYDNQTVRRLPNGVSLIHAISYQNNLYALVSANESIRLPLSSIYGPFDQSDDSETETSSRPMVDIQPGDSIILRLDHQQQWACANRNVIKIQDSMPMTFEIIDDVMHLFYQKSNLINHYMIQNDNILSSTVVDENGGRVIDSMVVNLQLCLVVANSIESPQYTIYRWGNQQWYASEPLFQLENVIESTPVHQTSVASTDQEILFFNVSNPEKIIYRYYQLDGTLSNQTEYSLETIQQEFHPFLQWLIKGQWRLVLFLITLGIVFAKRDDVFKQIPSPNELSQLAPIFSRCFAYLLDLIPPFLIAYLIFDWISPEMAGEVDKYFTEVSQGNDYSQSDPMLINILAFYFTIYMIFILYQMVFELIFSTTPGKRAFGLQVVSTDMKQPTRKQILLRSVFRFIDMDNFNVLFLLIVTIRRQRVGDLIANTIVVKRPKNKVNYVINDPIDSDQQQADR